MSRKSYPTDLSDGEWQLIEPLLPAFKTTDRPRQVDLREITDAIFTSSTRDALGVGAGVTFQLGRQYTSISASGND